jgi:glycosyltransferase involved in cell wall biosynthesis
VSSLPKISIIILNWDNYYDTAECLRSLRSIDYPNYQLVLVDNGSSDGSADRLKKDFAEIDLIKNESNLGFAEGNNIGIKHALKGLREGYLTERPDSLFIWAKMKPMLISIIKKGKLILFLPVPCCSRELFLIRSGFWMGIISTVMKMLIIALGLKPVDTKYYMPRKR